MLRTWFVLCIIFILLTFAGAGYVLLNKGAAHAGGAVIPLLFALTFLVLYHRKRKDRKKEINKMNVQNLD